jgi:hypothetical protein
MGRPQETPEIPASPGTTHRESKLDRREGKEIPAPYFKRHRLPL